MSQDKDFVDAPGNSNSPRWTRQDFPTCSQAADVEAGGSPRAGARHSCRFGDV